MIGGLRKKRCFAIAGTLERTILAEIGRGVSAAEPALHLLAATEGAPDQEITIHRLLSALPDLRGTVAVALPLCFFEILTLALPVMPEEAVGKALPYHLAKALAKPLPDFIYDWQLNRRNRDSLEITAFLFPTATFNILRNELARKQLELKYLEPDVFAAFAYLALTGRLPADQATLCSLIWSGATSHAIYEHGRLKLARSVSITQPAAAFTAGPDQETPMGETAAPADLAGGPLPSGMDLETPGRETVGEEAGPDEDIFADDADDLAILADFSMSLREHEAASAPPAPDFSTPPESRNEEADSSSRPNPSAAWPEYINSLGLEIIRTTDFYGRILKGSSIDHFFVGGGEEFLQELGSVTKPSMNLEPEELGIRKQLRDLPSLLEAICIGTGVR
ncbi:MAG: hypothetical protein P1P81_07135 [Desulfobulbales bacterium]|nr:hypothetical protein [Desulfobulbales bacterium]